jgi:hypothetical protein
MGTHVKIKPSSRRRGGPISKHINGVGTNKNLVISPDGTQKAGRTVLARASSNLLPRASSNLLPCYYYCLLECDTV